MWINYYVLNAENTKQGYNHGLIEAIKNYMIYNQLSSVSPI